jgi:hypothetical protein
MVTDTHKTLIKKISQDSDSSMTALRIIMKTNSVTCRNKLREIPRVVYRNTLKRLNKRHSKMHSVTHRNTLDRRYLNTPAEVLHKIE